MCGGGPPYPSLSPLRYTLRSLTSILVAAHHIPSDRGDSPAARLCQGSGGLPDPNLPGEL